LKDEFDVVILGAGPAGLTAAVEALNLNKSVLVLEIEDQVGGISKTVQIDGWRFDLGGHRFFTKVQRIEDFWKSILSPGDFLKRPRLSRIYYNGKFFDYPLKPINALIGLGLIETLRCVSSFFGAKLCPPRDQTHFEGWVVARFGRRLYEIFFKTYTQKVWGIPTTKLSSAWAAQRIKNLSLSRAILDAFGFKGGSQVVTLIDSFDYPRLGPGMMWEKCAQIIEDNNLGEIRMKTWCVSIDQEEDAIVVNSNNGEIKCSKVISSIPLSALPALVGCEDDKVLDAAANLNYRDFLTVGLIVLGEETFPDNWIYVHSSDVRVGRIQNFRSWSPDLVKPGFSLLGLEYFVDEGDDLWEMKDRDLVDLGTTELIQLGLVSLERVIKGYVVRVPKAYPVYNEFYEQNVSCIANWLDKNWPNLYTVGRNGMHRYNNQDHSMLTGMLAVENAFLDMRHNLWEVNVDNEYHESKEGSSDNFGGRSAPIFKG
jgi:protoporphyrinogen oxidase